MRVLRVLALLALIFTGCGEDGSPPEGTSSGARVLERRRPLVTFHPDARVRVREDGDPRMQWLLAGDRPSRAFACRQACSVTFRAGDHRGGWLEAVASVAGGPGSARLAVLASEKGAEAEAIWSAELASGERRTLRVPLPATEAGEIRLTAGDPTGEAKVLWVEPTFVAPRGAAAPPPSAPNVVLVTSDTTRQDELGLYGGRTRTPEIDRLGAEGVVFDAAHSVAFATNPSHASLMTSSWAATHGVEHNGIILGTALPTLAEVLGSHGWATAAFVSAVVLTRRAGLGRGFDLYDDTFGIERRGDLTVSLFEQWLEERDAVPFFAWIHLYDPHQPYDPPEGFAEPYLDGLSRDAISRIDAIIEAARSYDREGFIEPRRIEEEVGAASLPDLERLARARYRGEIAFVDEQVGRIRAALEARGLLEDTIVVFTADHGENFLDRGTAVAYDHTGVRADVARIPLVIRLPGGRSLGRSDAIVANIDIAPTLTSLAAVEPPPAWAGRPLLSPLGRLQDHPRGHLVVEGSHRREVSVRTDAWLYRELREWARDDARIGVLQGYAAGAAFELYDLARDPGERHSAYRPDHPSLPDLREWIADFDASHTREGAALQVDPEQLRALEALGYRKPPEPGIRQ